VDPSPDANVTGIGMSVALAVGTVVVGTANIPVTGKQLTVSKGNVTVDLNTPVDVTGKQLTIGLNSVVAGISAEAPITGNSLTIQLNSINNQIWKYIDTGTTVDWINIDTAA